MRVFVLASGSEGNAVLVEAGGARVLVDAGLNFDALEKKVDASGASDMPQAVVVTHAHHDHAGCARQIARRLRIPIYATAPTARALRLDPMRARVFKPREAFSIGDLAIAPVPVPHDAPQVALVFDDGRFRASIATDLGAIPSAAAAALGACDLVLIESNHDEGLLATSDYHPKVKARIRSPRGHLSNAQTHRFLRDLPGRASAVALLHLSQSNNTEELALASARSALAGRRIHLFAARQHDTLMLDAKKPPPMVAIGGARARGSKGGPLPGQLSLF